MTKDYGQINLEDAADVAEEWGLTDVADARYVREQVGAQTVGVTRFRMPPSRRFGFGHRHAAAEEMYVVLAGEGCAKLGDAVIPLRAGDVVRAAPSCVRSFESGPAGLELLATGAHAGDDAEVVPDFWPA